MRRVMEIIRLSLEGRLSHRQINRATGVSRPVVSECLAAVAACGLTWPELSGMTEDGLQARLFPVQQKPGSGRCIELEKRFPLIQRELARRGVTLQLLWKEYRSDCPTGYGYSQFCGRYEHWAKPRQELWMPQTHKAGDKMFVDYAGQTWRFFDGVSGVERFAKIFVAILGASQLTYAEAMLSEQSADFIRGSTNALQYFGGVPAVIVLDNLKSGVKKANRYEPELNPSYQMFASYHGTAIMPARPVHPKDKPLVEGMVNIVYQQIFAPLRDRTFFSLAELNEAIRVQLVALNERPQRRDDLSRRQRFEAIERTALKPLPAEPYRYRDFQRGKAGFNYHVYLKEDKHYYSVPYKFAGKPLDLFYSASAVEIMLRGERVCIHPREQTKGGYTTVSDHMPSNHQWVAEWSPDRLANWAAEIGPQARELVVRLLKAKPHPEMGFHAAAGVINLQKKYGRERVELACGRALAFGGHTYMTVKRILERGMERDQTVQPSFETLPDHGNIRGGKYYEETDSCRTMQPWRN